MWEAKQKCAELVVTPARHKRYVEFHDAIVAEIWRHIPVTQGVLDRRGRLPPARQREFARTGDRARAPDQGGHPRQRRQCLTSSVGIAPNRLLAKLASDLQKPDGLIVFAAEQLPHALYDLQLREIAGIGAKMERRLARDGINDIRQLCERRPRDAGEAWGGVNGDRLWFALHGVDLPEKPTQARTIGHSHVLSPDKRHYEPVRLTARRLALRPPAGCAAKAISRGCWCSTRGSRTTNPAGARRSNSPPPPTAS